MIEPDMDMKALAEAFDAFTKTTVTMEESYRRLQDRIEELDKELAEKNRQLAFTSDYLNYMLESMSEGVIAVDTEGIITRFNHAATHVLGYAREQVVGRSFQEIFKREFSVPPGRHARDLLSKEDKRIPVSERDSPISDRNHRRIGTVKVFEDLSELEALRARVRQKDRLAAVGEMAATVAHEIRNPLGGIKGFAALLARDIEEADPRARLVQKILTGVNQLDRVVGELLEYTRPVKLRLGPISCCELLSTTLRYLPPSDHNASIANRVDPDVRVMGDSDKLRQVLLNILINAVQSIDGDEGQVEITSAVEEESVVISIADNGCGIKAEDLEKVFSPFYTTREKGTGLGLAVASKIVEVHGGALRAESRPGAGSVFHVRLPRLTGTD